MPTYQYACTECGEPLEAVQSFTDDPLTECPSCGGRLRKVFSAVGVVFKGSGFYRNDSRAGNGSKEPAATGSSESKESGSKESGSKESGSKESGSKESGSGSTSSEGSSSSSDSSSGSNKKSTTSTNAA